MLISCCLMVIWTGCLLQQSTPAQSATADENTVNKTKEDQPAADKAEVLEVLRKQVAGWNAGDLERFMATYWRSPQLTFSAGGQTTRGWQATLDRYRRRYPDRKTMGKLTFSNPEFTSLGAEAALVLGNWRLDREEQEPAQGNFSIVLRKMNGRWLIVHDHSSSLESE